MDPNSLEGQQRFSELLLSFLTLRANTPVGEWLDEDNAAIYDNIYDELEELEPDPGEREEGILLMTMNMAWFLLQQLVSETGRSQEDLLQELSLAFTSTSSEG